MAATSSSYYLGGKRVVSKKTGEVYNFVRILRQNRWQDWETVSYTCDSDATLDNILNTVKVGDPVKVLRDDNDDVVSLTIVKDVKRLEI